MKNIDNRELFNEALVEKIKAFWFEEISENRVPSVNKIAAIYTLTWPRAEKLLKKADPSYKTRMAQIKNENKINMQRLVTSYYLSESQKGNFLSIGEITEKFPVSWMEAREYLKEIVVKANNRLVRYQQKTKKEVIWMFLAGADKEEIYKKYQDFSKRTINGWLAGFVQVRINRQKDERKKDIRNYYLSKIKVGSPPTDMEMTKRFNIGCWALNECLKDIKIYAPENGIYELEIDGAKKVFMSCRAIADLIQYTPTHLQRLLKKKISDRIFLFNRDGSKKYFYPLARVWEIYPKLEEVFNHVSQFLKINDTYKLPAELKEIEYLVLTAIVTYQEKYFRKCTKKAINTILRFYKFSGYRIDKVISRLKSKNYITEEEMFFFINRGPLNLVTEKKFVYNRKLKLYEERDVPRIFTADKWSIMDADNPFVLQQSAKHEIFESEKTKEEYFLETMQKSIKAKTR